jgi:hypothetical protein
VGKPERPKSRWEYNIKTDLYEIGWEGMSWLNLAQDRGKWRAVVITVMNILGLIKCGKLVFPAEHPLASRGGLAAWWVEVVSR